MCLHRRLLQGTSSVCNQVSTLIHEARLEKGDPRANIENISHAGFKQAGSRRLMTPVLFSREEALAWIKQLVVVDERLYRLMLGERGGSPFRANKKGYISKINSSQDSTLVDWTTDVAHIPDRAQQNSALQVDITAQLNRYN